MENNDIINKFREHQINSSNQKWDKEYLALGLGGECGEILNEIKKIKRDDNNYLNGERRDKIELELGDLLWYYFGLLNELNLKFEDVVHKNISKLKKKKKHISIIK